jgi:hypothetical protein
MTYSIKILLHLEDDSFMRIKEPNSNNALQSLYEQIDLTQEKLANCVVHNHDITAILYISSLIITPNVIFNGRKLLQEISNIVGLSPKCICVVRTTTPSYFPSGMKSWQKKSIDFLRDKCYVVVYSKRREFLNHAKFFVHYQVCFSEGTVHFGNFHGSTNLTTLGLGNPHGRGNYEQFMEYDGIKYSLSRRDKSYLSEVLDLISHKALLYTDRKYLAQHVSDHQKSLERLLRQGSWNDFGFPQRELYERYINSLVMYDQTFAFLDEIPGKKLTEEIIDKLGSLKPPTNPFEIEMMFVDPEYVELILEDLSLSENTLKDLIEENISAVRNAFGSIKEIYQSAIEKIEDFIDEKEAVFLEYLNKNNKTHISDLERIIKSIE